MNERKDAWGNILGVNIDFSKMNECEVESKKLLSIIFKNIRTLELIKNLWRIFMKNGLIEKKFNDINWYKTGLAIGGIRSILIKLICILTLKKGTMKAWNSRFFRK